MQSIENTSNQKRRRRSSWTTYWASILAAVVATLALAISQCYGANMQRDNSVAVSGGLKPNVSCIAHDSKFTCDCQHQNQEMQLPRLAGYVFQVEIRNCRSLVIEANTLEETQGLRKITIKHVDNLALQKYALAFPRYASNTPLIIEFEQVNFEVIDSHAINGNIEEISFIGGRIDVIHPFGFTTLKDRAILLKMDNVFVKKIESQAFKKFAVEQLEITNCIFATNVPSKAFYELEVLTGLRIHNNRFQQEVHSRAFSFKMISKLSITSNQFAAVDAEWIEAHVRESPLIRDNHFGATSPISFKGIAVHRDYVYSDRLELRFINNTVRFAAEPRPLEFSERFTLSVEQLHYENVFACKDVDTSLKPPQPKVTFFRQFSNNVYFQSESTSTATNNHQSFVVLSKIIEGNCQQPSYLLYILLGVLVLVLILIIVLLLLWWRKRRKMDKMMPDVVMPESRTYKETQIVYQIENAGLLKTDL